MLSYTLLHLYRKDMVLLFISYYQILEYCLSILDILQGSFSVHFSSASQTAKYSIGVVNFHFDSSHQKYARQSVAPLRNQTMLIFNSFSVCVSFLVGQFIAPSTKLSNRAVLSVTLFLLYLLKIS